MNLTNDRRIYFIVKRRMKMRKKEKNKLKGMDQESRRKLIKKKKGVVKRVSPFIMGEAIECNRNESPVIVESGFEKAVADLLPRDTTQKRYLKVPIGCRRLLKVKSLEFFDCSAARRNKIRVDTLVYYDIKRGI